MKTLNLDVRGTFKRGTSHHPPAQVRAFLQPPHPDGTLTPPRLWTEFHLENYPSLPLKFLPTTEDTRYQQDPSTGLWVTVVRFNRADTTRLRYHLGGQSMRLLTLRWTQEYL